MEECEINILEGMGRHMSYYDVITNVERRIERETIMVASYSSAGIQIMVRFRLRIV